VHALCWYDTVDQPDAKRIRRTDRLPEVDELARATDADPPHQPLRSAEPGDEAEVDLRLPEARSLGGDDEVAGERELEPSAERDAADGGHHRDRQRFEAGEDLVAEPGVRMALRRRHRGHRADVGTGGECLFPRTHQHDGEHAGVAAKLTHGT